MKTMTILKAILAANEGSADIGKKVEPVLKQFMQIGGIVFPVVLAIGAILIIIKLVLLGVKLAQSGDDPEQRSRIIKGMVWWGIGLLVTIAACVTAGVLFQTLQPEQ